MELGNSELKEIQITYKMYVTNINRAPLSVTATKTMHFIFISIFFFFWFKFFWS